LNAEAAKDVTVVVAATATAATAAITLLNFIRIILLKFWLSG
jgi:hypothetical protein